MKDQTKKVASLKHKEQVEKSKNARLMDEARKREDNMSESSLQVKVRLMRPHAGILRRKCWVKIQIKEAHVCVFMKDTLRQKTERIEELEEALRESVQITAEREMVLAQEEAARSLQEKQVDRTRTQHTSALTINRPKATVHLFLNISAYGFKNLHSFVNHI